MATGANTYMFDDFSYRSLDELEANGWTVRTEKGWPGSPKAIWDRNLVGLVDDPENPGNRLLRLSAKIGAEIRQSQVCHRRKYLEGTYAARVRFTTGPSIGENGDQMVETFYSITPYDRPYDPAYSEMDFEFLPNGGWGLPSGTLVTTTWETVRIEPWSPQNESSHTTGEFGGWHTLVIQAISGRVDYLLDGEPFASHSDPNYPSSPMSVNFNLWLIDGGEREASSERHYLEDVDWVYHAQDALISSDEVERQVRELRDQGIRFFDNVSEADPPLECPCNM